MHLQSLKTTKGSTFKQVGFYKHLQKMSSPEHKDILLR